MTYFEYKSPSPKYPRELTVQNRRANTLVAFALETARRYETAESEPAEIQRIANWYDNEMWPGMIIDIATVFPTAVARRFWCRVFFDAAHHVVHGSLGKPEARFGHAGLICDLVTVARILFGALRDLEPEWIGPMPIDWREEEAYNARLSGGAN
jgi:hypothetical protein